MQIVEKIAFVPVRDGKIPFARSVGKVKFSPIGGRREMTESGQPETRTETLIREVFEEAGVNVVRHSVKLDKTFFDELEGKPDKMLRLYAFTGEFTGAMKPGNEIVEIRWFGADTNWRPLDKMSQQMLRHYVKRHPAPVVA